MWARPARRMQPFGPYVRGVLVEARSAYEALGALGDRPGDLGALRREWSRAHGLLCSLAARLEAGAPDADPYRRLSRACSRYAGGYDFGREIEAVSALYAGDPGRLRSMRLKMLETLEEGGLMRAVSEAIDELEAA